MRLTLGLVDGDVAPPAEFRELRAQPALADPGLRDDADDLALSGEHLLRGGLELRHLGGAADEAGEPSLPGDVESPAGSAEPDELVHTERLARTLHLELAEVPQLDIYLDKGGG